MAPLTAPHRKEHRYDESSDIIMAWCVRPFTCVQYVTLSPTPSKFSCYEVWLSCIAFVIFRKWSAYRHDHFKRLSTDKGFHFILVFRNSVLRCENFFFNGAPTTNFSDMFLVFNVLHHRQRSEHAEKKKKLSAQICTAYTIPFQERKRNKPSFQVLNRLEYCHVGASITECYTFLVLVSSYDEL